MPSKTWLFSGAPQASHLFYRRLKNIANYFIVIQHKINHDISGYVIFKSNPRPSTLASIDQQLTWEKSSFKEKENIYFSIDHSSYSIIQEHGIEQERKDKRKKVFLPSNCDLDYCNFLATYKNVSLSQEKETMISSGRLRDPSSAIADSPYQITNKKRKINSIPPDISPCPVTAKAKPDCSILEL